MTAAVRVCENVRQNCRYAILKNNLRRTENVSLVEEDIKIGRGITSTPYYIRGISHIDMRKYIFA